MSLALDDLSGRVPPSPLAQSAAHALEDDADDRFGLAALYWFRLGLDTADIADMLDLPEALVERILHREMDRERAVEITEAGIALIRDCRALADDCRDQRHALLGAALRMEVER